MAKMVFDEEGLLEEPCLSCDKHYVEDLWNEWCCDEKVCPYKVESEDKCMKTVEVKTTMYVTDDGKKFDNLELAQKHEKRIKALDQEHCGDAISRILKRMWNCRGKHTTSIDKVKMEQIIRDELSSTNPMADMLDKIETDIETLFKYYPFTRGGAYINKDDVNKIINKYKLEGDEI